jgi:hypothetical protein
MMNTQATMAEALLRRSKTLRWSGGHNIISMYQVIHVNTEAFLARLPSWQSWFVHKGVYKSTETKRAKKEPKAGNR